MVMTMYERMDYLNVNVLVCDWMSDLSDWNDCNCAARFPCNTGGKISCSQMTMQYNTYCCIKNVWDRESDREKVFVSEMKLFVRLTLCVFPNYNIMSSSPISYSLLMST